MQKIIAAKNLNKTYPGGDRPALDQVSMSVDKGEFLAITGQSGSGKSTLLNVLSALAMPESGQIFYADTDLVSAPEKVRNRFRGSDFAFIFQQHHLMPYLSALENTLLPYLNQLKPVNAELREKGKNVLSRVGLAHKMDSRPGELSGGEQQRVAIARALARDAQILFADEPTGSLDSETGQTVISLMRQLNRDGLTIVMVTHNNDYAALADRTIHMKDGCILAA